MFTAYICNQIVTYNVPQKLQCTFAELDQCKIYAWKPQLDVGMPNVLIKLSTDISLVPPNTYVYRYWTNGMGLLKYVRTAFMISNLETVFNKFSFNPVCQFACLVSTD
jgi:hypothetical protein